MAVPMGGITLVLGGVRRKFCESLASDNMSEDKKFQSMVDNGQIKFNPAVELSYLAREEQKDFLEAMDYAQAAPSLSQAQRIKKLAQSGECTLEAMCDIM